VEPDRTADTDHPGERTDGGRYLRVVGDE
jgi:hypothetical protein